MNIGSFCSLNLYNLSVLTKSRKSLLKKSKLVCDYIRITAKDVIFNKILNSKIKREKINGQNVHFLDYEFLRSLFEEIFIEEQYLFFPDKKDPLIIDCGANIGLAMIYFKSVYPEARVKCFEPDPATFSVLKKNIESNNYVNVSAYQNAIAGQEGSLDFYIESNREASLSMSLYNESFENTNKEKKKITVDAVLLSGYIEEPVDLLKIDVEGAEYNVFDDLDKTGKLKLVKNIIIEGHVYNDDMRKKIQDLLKTLEKNNFQFLLTNPFGLSNITQVESWKFMLYVRQNN